ncbi:MAG: putative secreted protein [Polyangiaceae bacterium]|nr:putative secreted protein [Polyangiaceae bacterium]
MIGATISAVKAKARVGGALTLFFSLISGCQASVNAGAQGEASANGEGAKARAEAEASGQAEGEGEMSRSALAPNGKASALVSASASSASVAAGRVLLGARHDLKLRAGKGSTSCECLSVALGGSRSSAMLWSAVPPDIDESMQLSIALSSEGQACKGEPKKSLGASYWGYRLSGNDVVVLVEAARGGRPLTNGAIIPKPVGTGQVYVAPTSKKLPYGRALEGNGLCKIGNPGAVRSAPFTELEVGFDAPTRGAPAPALHGSSAPLDDTPTTIDIPAN